MPTYNSRDILNELTENVEQTLRQLAELEHLTDAELNQQPQPGKWSIAQVLEHLNSYNRYYLPEISIALQKGKRDGVKFNPLFKTGWFGNYFTNMMLPKGGKIKNKTTSPKGHRPPERLNSKKVVAEFLPGNVSGWSSLLFRYSRASLAESISITSSAKEYFSITRRDT